MPRIATLSLFDLMTRLGIDSDRSLSDQTLDAASASATPLKAVILLTHDENGESSYFRQVGFKDFHVDLAGVYDIGDPDHRPTEYAESFDDMEEEDEEDLRRVSLTRMIERCGFGGLPVSKTFSDPLLFTSDKSTGRKGGTRIFVGAHDGSNDAYWTLRVGIHHCQQQATAQDRFRASPYRDWEQPNQTSMQRPFFLVAVDFEATVNGKVRQVGIATLDSEDLISPDGDVIAMQDWKDFICVRSLIVEEFKDAKHEHTACRPNTSPLYAVKGHEVMSKEDFVSQLRNVLHPVSCRAPFKPVVSPMHLPL